MIKVRLQGGLGNQMFQYAAARALSLDLKQESLILDTNYYVISKKKKSLTLNNCTLSPSATFKDCKDNPFYYLASGMSRLWPKFTYALYLKFGIAFWNTSLYKELPKNKENLYLFGYWQSDRYFNKYKDLIIRELKMKTLPSKKNLDLIHKMGEENSCCIHIRRGDYVKLNWVMCDNAYYQKGMEIVATKVENPKFYIFSDDIEWVKKEIKFTEPVTYIDWKNEDFRELELMYSCKHFVMSNSSFSWWAQYISNTKDSVIIAPKQWFSDYEEGNKDLKIYLDNWVKI